MEGASAASPVQISPGRRVQVSIRGDRGSCPPALNPLWEEDPEKPSGLTCRAGSAAEPILSMGLSASTPSGLSHPGFVSHVSPCVFSPHSVNRCGHLGRTTVDGEAQPMPTEALSRGGPGCPAGLSCHSSLGPPKAVWGRQAGELVIIVIIYCYYFYFFSVSGSADPQMLLMEIRPVYMLILSPLTSGLLFS